MYLLFSVSKFTSDIISIFEYHHKFFITISLFHELNVEFDVTIQFILGLLEFKYETGDHVFNLIVILLLELSFILISSFSFNHIL